MILCALNVNQTIKITYDRNLLNFTPMTPSEKITKKAQTPKARNYGPIPVDTIFKYLGIELEEGEVVLSAKAQIHAARRHPEDFSRCLPYLQRVISTPDYIGDDFKNENKIELISLIPELGNGLLIALSIQRDSSGNYHIASFYPVSFAKITNRCGKGYLKSVPKK